MNRFVGVTEQEESSTVLLGELRVHVNADEDADERDSFQMRMEREVTGRAEIANECIEAFDVGVVSENACEFGQQGIGAFVGEKACGHRANCIAGGALGASGITLTISPGPPCHL